MRLTENEKSLIYHNIRLAKDQANQIIIEAELNSCNTDDIKNILAERGVDISQYEFSYSNAGFVEPKLSKERTIGFKNNPKAESKARELYEQGLNDAEIAKIMGVSNVTIASWRHDNDLETQGVIKSKAKTQERYKLILELEQKGYTNKQIAERLGFKVKSIENIKSRIKKAAQLAL